MSDQIANQKVKILVVDDVVQNIQIIGNLLMSQGYQVVFALNGAEALGLINKTNFDLILLDIIMPPPDGLTVCKKIKSNPTIKDVPIIFLTAKSDITSIIKGFEAGAQDYVSKPFRAEELLARVRTQVQLKKQREELETITLILEDKVNERTQALNLANQRLAILEKAKSNFLLLISQELRSPLNVMNGFVEILESSLNSEEQIRSLNYLKNSAEKLTQLAETAQLITEIQLGKYSVSFEMISLTKVSSAVLDELKEVIDDRNLKIETTAFVNNDTFSGDYWLISDAIKRGILNAIKISPSLSRIKITIYEQNDLIHYSILDNGPGLNQQDQSGSIDMYNKSQTNLPQNGYSLNMVVVRLIMDIHSGKMTVENESGYGTKVTLSFPA